MARYQRRAGIGAIAIAITLYCAACTSSSKSTSSPSAPASPTSTTQGTAEFCSAYEALKASVQHLASLNVIAVGTNGLKAAADDVKQKAAALAASAGVFAPQVNAVTTAIAQLEATLRNLPSSGLRGALPTISSQITAVVTASRQLASAVTTACPTPTSS
jgi:hypothetical protein